MGTSDVDVLFDEVWLPVPTVGGLPSTIEMVVNRAESDTQVSVWQYGVFIIKLILSYWHTYNLYN